MRSSRLTTTFLLVLLALGVVLGVSTFVGVRTKDVLFPRWGGGLEAVMDGGARAGGRDVAIGAVDADGVRLTPLVDLLGTYVTDASCTTLRFVTAPTDGCFVRVSEKDLGPGDLRVTSFGGGEYLLTPPAGEKPVRVRVRAAGKYDRVARPSNLLSPRGVPAGIALLAFGALVFALARVRRAVGYARRMASWKELVLSREGMLQDDAGATVGTVSSEVALPPGPVLVDAEATKGTSIYRELAIVGRRAIASGSHTLWQRGTAQRLRDARVLSILATLASLLAGAAQYLAA